jgi:hypothetical protein
MQISANDHPDEPAALADYRKRVAAQHVSLQRLSTWSARE